MTKAKYEGLYCLGLASLSTRITNPFYISFFSIYLNVIKEDINLTNLAEQLQKNTPIEVKINVRNKLLIII